jgi:hypothetical protein
MVEVETSEMGAIFTPVSPSQQWAKFRTHCLATQESNVVNNKSHCCSQLFSKNKTDGCLKAFLEDMEEQQWFGIIFMRYWPKTNE